MFALAAFILFVLDAIFEFAGYHKISILGLELVAFACVAMHLFLAHGAIWRRGA